MKKKKLLNGDDIELTLLALPTTIWYLMFAYLPMFGVIIAFKKFKFIPGGTFIDSLLKSKWVGLDNFKFLFATPDAALMFRNTLAYNAVFIIVGMVITVSLALMISQLHSQKFAKIVQTAMFMPFFLSMVVVSYFVFSFLSADKGMVNNMLRSMGLETIQWYLTPGYWPGILLFINVWKGMGYGMVLYLAAITGIDASLYEAAIIDCASKWQQMKYITLPMLQPIIIILFIMSVGRIFSSDFGLFYQVPRNSGPLVDVTQTIDVYVYKALTGMNNLGFSSAAAFMQSVLGLITIVSANYIVTKVDKESALF